MDSIADAVADAMVDVMVDAQREDPTEKWEGNMNRFIVPDYIVSVFQNVGIDLNTVPILDLKGRGGNTDYIDFLSPEDMCRLSPIMKGVDRHGRPFISIQVMGPCHYIGLLENYVQVLTIFRRYTELDSRWTYGGWSSDSCFKGSNNINDKETLKILSEVLNRTHSSFNLIPDKAKRFLSIHPSLQKIFVQNKIIPLQRYIKSVIYSRLDFVISKCSKTTKEAMIF